MPELPEVQTIVNFLRPKILGLKIMDVKIISTRVARGFKNTRNLKNKITGKKIIDVSRRGKYIVLDLSSGEYLLFHLMMTGIILLNPKEGGKHDRMEIYLSGENKLVFNDIRQFGKCALVASVQNLVGEDPLEIKFAGFKKLLAGQNKEIKNFLLDQRHLAGIGNIYADEILWDADIHPLRKINTFMSDEIHQLYKSTKKILKLSIKKGGTSSRDYRKPDGSKGGYYPTRRVYQRTGEDCKKCGGKIKKIIVCGRSTHFCHHQK